MISNFDFITLSETWKSVSIDLEGFNIMGTSTLKNRKRGRSSVGLALIFKSNFNDWISVEKESPNFLWFKIAKEYTKIEKDIYVCGTYIPPQNSIYFYPELLKNLKTILRNSRLLDQFFSWVISSLEQANTQTMSVKRATPL